MNTATLAIFISLLADYIMVTLIVPIIQNLFIFDHGHIDEFRTGFVYSMKGISQLCTGLVTGMLSDRFQLKLLLQAGLTSNLIGSLIYNFGRKFTCYMLARTFHGIGSSLIAATGFSILASIFKSDAERGDVMSKAGSGIAFGVLSGPVVGGMLYSIGEKLNLGSNARIVPFSACTLLYIIAIVSVHFFLKQPYLMSELEKANRKKLKEEKKNKSNDNKNNEEIEIEKIKHMSNWQLLKNIPIVSLVMLSFVGNMQTSYIEPILPNYWLSLMKGNWNTLKSGFLFACSPLAFLVILPIVGKYGHRIGRHYFLFAGLILISSIFLIILPSRNLVYMSGIFLFIMGIGSAFIDGSLQPSFAQSYDALVEKKLKEKNLTLKVGVSIGIEKQLQEINKKKESKTLENVKENENENINNGNDNNVIKEKGENINEACDSSTYTIDISEANKTNDDLTSKSENTEVLNEKNTIITEDESLKDQSMYTRVFSLGNMAMNMGFILGPMISSFFMSLVSGEDPNINRFASAFFKCTLLFSTIGFLTSPVAFLTKIKKNEKIEKDEKN